MCMATTASYASAPRPSRVAQWFREGRFREGRFREGGFREGGLRERFDVTAGALTIQTFGAVGTVHDSEVYRPASLTAHIAPSRPTSGLSHTTV